MSTADALGGPAPPMTPDQFVREIGAWLAEEPCTVDPNALRILLGQVVSA